MNHMGMVRALYRARIVDSNINRQSIQKMVGSCDRCRFISSAMNVQRGRKHPSGTQQLAEDVTYYQQGTYLSIFDQGPE